MNGEKPKSPIELLRDSAKLRDKDEIYEAMFLLVTAQPEHLDEDEIADLHIAGGALMWALGVELDGYVNPIGDAIKALREDALNPPSPPPLVQIYNSNDLRKIEK